MFTKLRAIEKLKELKLPAVFVDLFEGRSQLPEFDILCGVPEELYLCSEEQQKDLIPTGYEPLWDDGNFDAIYCYVYADRSLKKLYVEGGEKCYPSFNHYVADLMVSLWEHEWHELLSVYASSLEFPHADTVIDFIKSNHSSLEFEQFETALFALIESLNQTDKSVNG